MQPEKETLKSKVFQALGTASMCWSETPKGIFDDKEAVVVGEKLMEEIESDIPNAITALKKAFSGDQSEGSYYYAWQANIAMAFYDECEAFRKANKQKNITPNQFAEVGNRAAKRFLNQITQ